MMINRMYFYKIKWNHGHGAQGYMFSSGIIYKRSWLKHPDAVYYNIADEFRTKCKAKYPKGSLEFVSFNQI